MSVADTSLDELITEISEQPSIELAATKYRDAFNIIANGYGTQVSSTTVESERQKMEANIEAAQTCDTSTPDNTQGPDDVTQPADATTPTDTTIPDDGKKSGDKRSDEEKQKALEEKTKAYDDAKATEQSLANRTLTAGAIATTGIGGMELAMGLSQQAADAYADQSMAAYIATMRCSYGSTKQVKAGPDEIELPGGNDADMMKLRAEYFALAADLKERKEALGMKPGIESEEIIDKSQTGLYDDENLGIDSGAYASLYRAQMLGSETDQQKIDEERKASKNRVIAGGTLVGVGVIGGIVGNSLINGKLGEKIRENKARRKAQTVSALDTKEEIKTLSQETLERYKRKYGDQ